MAKGPVKLKETHGDFASDAKVIDAQFTVVKRPRERGGFFSRVLRYLLILIGVAVVGFLIPPAWVIVTELARK